MKRSIVVAATLALGTALLAGGRITALGGQQPMPPEPKLATGPPDPRFADLDWRFVRVKYHFRTEGSRFSFSDFGEPWYIDAPAADQNLTRRMRGVTSIRVGDPIIVAIDDPNLFLYPWIYMVEAGQNLDLTDKDAATLREYLLRGGTLTTDDSHGPLEWDNLERQLKKVFPDRPIVELTPPHPVFTCFYTLDKYPQVPGLGSFLAGRTWEKGGVYPHLRTIYDDARRPMVFINFNTDMGDGVEWSNSEQYPGYVKHSADAYRMYINEIVYALTH
ncbi:MAG: DUF4159 domain-containing protein [Bacteroidales bacterium]